MPVFFSTVLPAIAAAQEQLERRGGLYAIPRARAVFHSHLDREGGLRSLFHRRPPGEHNIHTIRYTVVSTPEPFVPVTALPRIPLRLPSFLLPAATEQQIAREATGATAKSPEPGEGSVCFVLPQSGRYFVATLASDASRDGIYLYRPGERAVRRTRYQYGPFHELFTAFTAWQNRPNSTLHPADSIRGLQWGWQPLEDLLLATWNDYQRASRQLAACQPSGTPPVYHRIEDFEASFHYSSWRDPDTDVEDGWIHNHASARYDTQHPAPELELHRPEFLLGGAVRDRLLQQIADLAQPLAAAFTQLKGPAPAPQVFETAPADALVLLSYDGRCPTKGFLTIWPTPAATYIFTFDSDGQNIQSGWHAHLTVPAGEELTTPVPDTAFRVIRNFFRAVRLWRTRTVPTPDPAD